jgi:hypothetical protein
MGRCSWHGRTPCDTRQERTLGWTALHAGDFDYCGRRVRVADRHKTCGPVQGRYVALQTMNLVHLGYRCSGKAHDGCQNGCLIFRHTAWLDKTLTQRRRRATDTALHPRGCLAPPSERRQPLLVSGDHADELCAPAEMVGCSRLLEELPDAQSHAACFRHDVAANRFRDASVLCPKARRRLSGGRLRPHQIAPGDP